MLNQPSSLVADNLRSDLSIVDLCNVLRKRRLIVLGTAVLGLLVGSTFALRPRKYVADGSMWIKPGTASIYRTSPMGMLSDEVSDRLASEAQILQSRTLYLRVAKELDLYDNPAFARVNGSKHPVDDPSARDRLFRLMSKQIVVTHNPKDQIVRIACTTQSPELSAKIVNTLIADYIDEIFTLHFGASQRTSSWLRRQLRNMKDQVESDQATLMDLQRKLGVVGFDPKSSDYLQAESLDIFTKAAGEATIEKIVTEAKYRSLKSSDPGLIEGGQQVLSSRTVPNSSQGTLIQSLRSAQGQVAANYAHLLAQYGRNYPEVKQARAELDEITGQVKKEEQRILNQAKLAYLAADANQKMTTEALNRKRTEAFQNKTDMVKYALLQQEYASHRDLYEGLVRRLEEATFTSGLESSEVDIVDIADTPSIPKPPGPLLYLLGSLCGGLIGGCSLAWIGEALDGRVEDGFDVSNLLGAPLLAVLPHVKRAHGKDPLPTLVLPEVVSEPQSPYSEALQFIPASTLLAGGEGVPRIIMITSGQIGEGKSFTARNLAVILSQHGFCTLLMDCDLRRGDVASQLGISNTHGVSDVLAGQISLDDAIQPVPGCPNLFAVPSGSYPRLPAVQVASERMANLLQDSRKYFDFIILDAPPLLGVSDALSIGRFADASIFITRYNMTTKKMLIQLRSRAASVNLRVLGCVHNDVNPRLAAYEYYEQRTLQASSAGTRI